MVARLLRTGLSLTLWLFAQPATAEPPTITGLSPQAVRPGQTVELTVHGTSLAAVRELWTSFPAETELASAAEDGKSAVFRINVPDSVPVGIHTVRVANDDGTSPLTLVLADDLPSLARSGENTSPVSAQAITTPVAVDGVVGGLERQYFRFSVTAGERLAVEVLAQRIGSPLDPVLRLLDADGREIESRDDTPGLGGDPRVCHTFTAAGECIIELRDIRYAGGREHRYRLRIGDFPCATVPYPLGVQRGAPATLQVLGPDLDGVTPQAVTVPTEFEGREFGFGVRGEGNSSGFVTVAVSNAPERVESEPNDNREQATPIMLGEAINARFEQSGDVDHFRFTARKGQKYRFQGVTRQVGSPVDLVLKLSDATGKQLAENDDAGSADALLTHTFPADGDYILTAVDLNRRGGPALAYRIATEEDTPTFALSAASDHLNVPAGGVAVLTVTVNRAGHTGPISLSFTELPAGLSAAPAVVGPGQGIGLLTLHANEDAPRGKVLPIRVMGTATVNGTEVSKTATITASLPHSTVEFAAAVTAPPPFTLRVEPAEGHLKLAPKSQVTFQVIAQRGEGAAKQGPIELSLQTVPVNGKPAAHVPPNVTAEFKPIPDGGNTGEVTLVANDKAAAGQYSVVVVGTWKDGKTTLTQPTPAVIVEITAKP